MEGYRVITLECPLSYGAFPVCFKSKRKGYSPTFIASFSAGLTSGSI
jgi:hypothetical protein